jgi:hypothetical protein
VNSAPPSASDLLVGHFNNALYCNLPLTTLEEMDASIEDRMTQRIADIGAKLRA